MIPRYFRAIGQASILSRSCWEAGGSLEDEALLHLLLKAQEAVGSFCRAPGPPNAYESRGRSHQRLIISVSQEVKLHLILQRSVEYFLNTSAELPLFSHLCCGFNYMDQELFGCIPGWGPSVRVSFKPLHWHWCHGLPACLAVWFRLFLGEACKVNYFGRCFARRKCQVDCIIYARQVLLPKNISKADRWECRNGGKGTFKNGFTACVE